MTLSFATLRKANTLRLPQFKNSRGGPAHSKPDGSDWSKGEWMNAILGELGETANLVKKVKRGDMPLEAAMEELAYEFADVVIYTDLTAMQCGVEFGKWVTFKDFRRFNIPIFNGEEHLSLGEWMNKCACSFGMLAKVIDDMNRHPMDKFHKPALEKFFVSFLAYLDCAAIKLDINLDAAIVRKFNMVSARVKAEVFISPDWDRVIKSDGEQL